MDASLHDSRSPWTRREAVRLLVGRLSDFGRRSRSVALMRAGLRAAAALLLALLGGAYLDVLVGLPAAARLIVVVGSAALGLGVLVWTLVSSWRGGRLDAMARDVDRMAGTGGQVTAGLDLTELPSGTPDLTAALAVMSVRKAGEIVTPLPEEEVVPLRPLKRAGAALAGAFIVLVAIAFFGGRAFRTEMARLLDPWGDHPPYSRHTFEVDPGDAEVVYGQSVAVRATLGGPPAEEVSLRILSADGDEQELPMFQEKGQSWRVELTSVTDPLTYWVTSNQGRSRRYHVGVIYTPLIESLAVRITPPAYTNLPARDGRMPEGGISGLAGTRVALTAGSNRPLSAARVRITGEDGTEETLAGQPLAGDPRTALVEFTIRQKGEMKLWVEDDAGEPSSTTVTAPVFLLTDHAPAVRITSPRQQSFATPDVPIPVTVEADDDYGVSALSLYRSLNGSRHLPEALMVPLPMERYISQNTELSLARYGLEPGDVISLFARVEDSDPAGAKGGESAVTRLQIISRELYERLLRARKEVAAFQQKYQEAARRLEELREEARELSDAADEAGEAPASEEMQQRAAELAAELADAAERTERAAEEQAYALDADLASPLRELAATLRQAEQMARQAAGRQGSPAMAEALRAAAAAIGDSEQAYQQDVMEPLEGFTKAFDLLEMQARYIDLAARQRDLAERMQELRGRDTVRDPQLAARMRDLLQEQEGLSEELGAVLQGIRDRAAVLPERPEFDTLRQTATDFADAVEASEAGESMKESAAGLEGGRGGDALEAATRAAEVLDSFIGRCRQGAGQSGRQCELAFGPKMTEAALTTAAQMLEALGLGGAYGQRGAGSGQGGYSMRSATLDNVGVYGPAPLGGGWGREEQPEHVGSVSAESEGGRAGEGGIVTSPGSGGYYARMLGDIPPRQRAHVRAYMRQVADELAAGRVLRPPSDGPNGEGEEVQ